MRKWAVGSLIGLVALVGVFYIVRYHMPRADVTTQAVYNPACYPTVPEKSADQLPHYGKATVVPEMVLASAEDDTVTITITTNQTDTLHHRHGVGWEGGTIYNHHGYWAVGINPEVPVEDIVDWGPKVGDEGMPNGATFDKTTGAWKAGPMLPEADQAPDGYMPGQAHWLKIRTHAKSATSGWRTINYYTNDSSGKVSYYVGVPEAPFLNVELAKTVPKSPQKLTVDLDQPIDFVVKNKNQAGIVTVTPWNGVVTNPTKSLAAGESVTWSVLPNYYNYNDEGSTVGLTATMTNACGSYEAGNSVPIQYSPVDLTKFPSNFTVTSRYSLIPNDDNSFAVADVGFELVGQQFKLQYEDVPFKVELLSGDYSLAPSYVTMKPPWGDTTPTQQFTRETSSSGYPFTIRAKGLQLADVQKKLLVRATMLVAPYKVSVTEVPIWLGGVTPKFLTGQTLPTSFGSVGGRTTVQTTITDFVGISEASLEFLHPDGVTKASLPMSRVGGTTQNGVWVATASIPKNVAKTEVMYKMTVIAKNSLGAERRSGSSDLTVAPASVPSFTYGNGEPTSFGPEGGIVYLKTDLEDATGVDEVIMEFVRPDGSIATKNFEFKSGSVTSGRWEGTASMPKNDHLGTTDIYHLTLVAKNKLGIEKRSNTSEVIVVNGN